jgi:hypothetical protein
MGRTALTEPADTAASGEQDSGAGSGLACSNSGGFFLGPSRYGLATVQLLDGVACAAQVPQIVEALDRVNCPAEVRKALPVIKVASAAGLALGSKKPFIGQATAAAMVAYFLAAIGFHVKAKDDPANSVPGVAMLVWSLLTLRAFRKASGDS